MQQDRYRLELVTPTRHLVSEDVDEVTAPGIEGEFGVLLGHTPFLTALGTGELSFRKAGEQRYLALSGGFAEIRHDKVTVLAEEALFAEEIDVSLAESTRKEAEEALAAYSHDSKEYLEAQARLERAMNQIQIVSRRR